MYVLIPSSQGKVGDKQKHNGLTYIKSSNGKWLLDRNKALKKVLRDLHVKKGMTIRAITKSTGIPHSTVQKALNDFGIMDSKKAKAQDLTKFVEKNLELLYKMYCELQMTPSEIRQAILKETGKNFKNIKAEMRRQGIPIRTHAESIKVATSKGKRRGRLPGEMVFSKPAVSSWNYHLDRSLCGLTFKQYKRIVHRFTYMVVKRFPHMFEDLASLESRRGRNTGLELDHQFSKFSGYWKFNGKDYVPRKQCVSLEIMCHPLNLKLMSALTNNRKNNANHIELNELENQIAEFEKEHGDIFEDYYGTYTKEELIDLRYC